MFFKQLAPIYNKGKDPGVETYSLGARFRAKVNWQTLPTFPALVLRGALSSTQTAYLALVSERNGGH